MTRSSCAGLYALCTHAVRGAAYRRLDHRYRAARRGGTLASARQQPAQRTRRAEVGAITALFERAEVLRRKQADRPAVVAALLKAQVAHFACHGATDWDDPQQSGLILADDERLTVEALLRLQLTEARLAVLSACETGLDGRQLPDEVVGLPTAFLNVGFAGVLASLWSVADWSTAQLMAQLIYSGEAMGWRRPWPFGSAALVPRHRRPRKGRCGSSPSRHGRAAGEAGASSRAPAGCAAPG